jgi:hypothetical protein
MPARRVSETPLGSRARPGRELFRSAGRPSGEGRAGPRALEEAAASWQRPWPTARQQAACSRQVVVEEEAVALDPSPAPEQPGPRSSSHWRLNVWPSAHDARSVGWARRRPGRERGSRGRGARPKRKPSRSVSVPRVRRAGLTRRPTVERCRRPASGGLRDLATGRRADDELPPAGSWAARMRPWQLPGAVRERGGQAGNPGRAGPQTPVAARTIIAVCAAGPLRILLAVRSAPRWHPPRSVAARPTGRGYGGRSTRARGNPSGGPGSVSSGQAAHSGRVQGRTVPAGSTTSRRLGRVRARHGRAAPPQGQRRPAPGPAPTIALPSVPPRRACCPVTRGRTSRGWRQPPAGTARSFASPTGPARGRARTEARRAVGRKRRDVLTLRRTAPSRPESR